MNVGGGAGEWLRAWRVGGQLKRLTLAERRDLLDLFTKSAGEVLDHWFESDPIKAVFGFDAVVGNFASPYTPGSAYVLLHHVYRRGERQERTVGACRRRHGCDHAGDGDGGTGTRRGRFHRRAGRARHDARQAQATGIVLADGTRSRCARRVVANVDPKLLYLNSSMPRCSMPIFGARIEAYRCASATFRMNVALDADCPNSLSARGSGAHLRAGIILAPSLAYMERAYFDARQHGWSREPIVEMLIPSLVETSLAPPGKHVASLFCQHANPSCPDGRHGMTRATRWPI